ncbi:hypothetical protein AK812_SmicGene28847 [Symbiodinium microadriaticum]|uniref:Uncharacterized protein n=1 Tax=Symbiodinium microadriaticum TaxID=2951 RepID=A0A1Q9D3A7_SYMMI|nr:hypothetical protein AK812_SmicGene28847 [Symbiodinium microadriaticum]CAE7222110.1 unnamed protein product [Symbiodinium microadriaticum]CAE7941486.1 unnamed protein product [Symbiodinium sp. KB8]
MANGMQSLGVDGPPSGYEPSQAPGGGGGGGSMAAVSQLFTRLAQEIEEQKPKNCIHFVVDFLCKHYPEHLHGFASIWQMDPDLERERHEVVNFFKAHKISTAVAAHFTNAGYDTLDTLTTLSPDSLVDVEAFNNVKWLPGHKVRLQQIFSEISARVRAYRQQFGEGQPNRRRHHQGQQGQVGNAPVDRRHDSPPNYNRSHHSLHDNYAQSAHPASHPHHAHHPHHPPVSHHPAISHQGTPPQPYVASHHSVAHPVSHPQHIMPVVYPQSSHTPQGASGDRHVAYTGGFSGGYSGGLAPPQSVAPMAPPAAGMSLSPGLPNASGNIFLANSAIHPPS